MDILREFGTAGRRGLRVADIRDRLELSWPTAHRMVSCMLEEQMLEPAGDPKRYRLGSAVFQLGLAATPYFSLRELCDDALERLAQQSGDTVFLAVRSAKNSVILDRREGGFQIKALPLEVGAQRPLGIGAGGLAILAALPEREAAKIMALNAHRLAFHGAIDAPRLAAMVRDTRERSYALDVGNAFPEVTGVGLPILTAGVPVAAISIAAISSRITDERVASYVTLLRGEVERIEGLLANLND